MHSVLSRNRLSAVTSEAVQERDDAVGFGSGIVSDKMINDGKMILMMVKVVIDCSDVRFTEFSRSNSPALSLHSPNAATLLLLMFQHTYRTCRFICWCS